MSNIQDTLNKLTEKPEYNSKQGEVIDIDLDNFTCEIKPFDGEANYLGVKLSAVPNASNILIPVVGSIVIISFLDKDNAFVSMTSANEKTIVRSIDEEGEIQASLITVVEQYVDEMKSAIDDLKGATAASTYATPAGVSAVAPINIVDYNSAYEAMNSSLDSYLEEMQKIFSE
jgi:hypothetical protein